MANGPHDCSLNGGFQSVHDQVVFGGTDEPVLATKEMFSFKNVFTLEEQSLFTQAQAEGQLWVSYF